MRVPREKIRGKRVKKGKSVEDKKLMSIKVKKT